MPRIHIYPDNVEAQVKVGTTLLRSASQAGVDIQHSCGGIGACTSCRVMILEGKDHLTPIGRAEEEQLKESGILHTHRLACQTAILGDVVIERPLWRSSLDSPITGE
ncbi:MAG: 2Fe-2S iron-sulfur cluster-binding protein [Terriglobia bacterium]